MNMTLRVVRAAARSGWSTKSIVLTSAFISVITASFMGIGAMSLTDVVPAVTTTWQSSIVCGSGEHLIAEEHDVPNATPTVSGGTGASWTYRCAGPDSTSDSRTAMVMFVQFLAGMLISGPAIFGLLLILGFEIAKRRRLQASIAPPFWPQVPPDPFEL